MVSVTENYDEIHIYGKCKMCLFFYNSDIVINCDGCKIKLLCFSLSTFMCPGFLIVYEARFSVIVCEMRFSVTVCEVRFL